MPCRSDYMEPIQGEHRATNEMNSRFKALADSITYSNDVLREHLLGELISPVFAHVNKPYDDLHTRLVKNSRTLYVAPDAGLIRHVAELVDTYRWLDSLVQSDGISATETALIRKQQIAHREADLTRLMKVFADKGDRVRLRKVLDADATKPLKPQLGFDADDF